MRSTKIRKDSQKNGSRGAQLCWCSIDTVRSCTRAQSTRCPVSLVCNWIVLSRWCTVNFVLNSLVPTCSKNGLCNRSGAHLYLCITESCLIARAQSIRCTNDRCSVFPTDTVFSEYGAQLYLCTIEPCPIGRAQSPQCTVGWCTIVSTGSVSSRHGAQVFYCTIGPCPVRCAPSIPCTVVWCSIGTIPNCRCKYHFDVFLKKYLFWNMKLEFLLIEGSHFFTITNF